MSEKIKPTDFRYYFAVDRGDYRRFREDFDGMDVLVSYVYLTEKADKGGKFAAEIAKHNGNVMIDSGGFTNFTTPGTVQFEEWLDFMKDASGWADEYVQFDDLASRPNTMRLYEKALSEGLDPLFVDHLWFPSHEDEVGRIWKSDEKVAISGFAKTLPGQRKFPGGSADPVTKLAERFLRGREVSTFNHLLAVGSLRRFMANLDRVHSVDSAAWDKAAAFGKVLVFEMDKWGDIDVPILKAYDRIDARVTRRPMPPEVKRDAWTRVVADNKWGHISPASLAKNVTVYHAKRYIKALQEFAPEALREQIAQKKVAGIKKSYFDFGERVELPGDNRVPDWNSTVGEDIDKMMVDSLATCAERPLIQPVLTMKDAELFANDIEKAKKPWFTYYFACSPSDLKKHFVDGDNDVLISFIHIANRKKEPRWPEAELKALKKKGRRIMLDSGAFTNFSKPGAVCLEQYLEFLKTPEVKEVFTEYVTFDDIRCRDTTMRNYVKMLEDGHDPLWVDHLWYDHCEAAESIWKSRDKLCLSGFATTLPTQEKFPGDPKARLHEAMQGGRDKETQVHLLAVSSMRRFLKYADRVDSVDSTAWAKAGVYSMFLHMEYAEINGITVPVQKVYDYPGSNRKQRRYAPPKEHKLAQRRVRQIMKEREVNFRQGYLHYSVEQARKYAAALNSMNPKMIVEAYETAKLKKGVDPIVAERGRGFAFISQDWGTRDWVKKDSGVSPSTSIDPEEVGVLDPRSYQPNDRTDAQLRQDWSVVSKLWEAFKQHGEAESGYKRNELISLATVIAKEAVRRGPELMVFDPEEMSTPVRELWGAVVQLIEPPADMVSKEVLTPTADFDGMDADTLLAAHTDLHTVATRVATSRGEADWSWEQLVNAHGRLVEALDSKGYAHPASHGVLDAVSSNFEKLDRKKWAQKSDASRLGEIEEGMAEADAILATVEEGVVKKMKAPSGASRPLEAVAVEKMVVAAGPPDTWDALAKAAVGPAWRRRLQTFWNKSNAETRRFLRNAHAERVEKSEGGAISSTDGAAKLKPLRYVSHIHYRGNQADMVLRLEKRDSISLETWSFPLPALHKSVTSLAKAEDLLNNGEAPLPGVGEVCLIKKEPPTPRGWLTSQGVTPPGSYGSSGSAPGVFHRIESGTYEATSDSEIKILKLTPAAESEDTRLLALRRVPVSGAHINDRSVQRIIHDQFDAPNLGDLVSKLALGDGGNGTWVGRFAVENKTTESLDKINQNVQSHKHDHPVPSSIATILKADKRLVAGIVLQPEVVDAQNDIISAEDIESAAHGFLATYNKETEMGLMHKVFGNVGIDLVESYVTPAEMEIGGKRVKKGTWVMVVKVHDDELWGMIKNGKLTGFSIGGVATSKSSGC